MSEGWKYIRFDDVRLLHLGNGFFGGNVIERDGFELTFIKGDRGSGHGFHRHEDLDEILVFLEGECDFTAGTTDIKIRGGSMLFIPPGVDHKVIYNAKSKVLRIKVPPCLRM